MTVTSPPVLRREILRLAVPNILTNLSVPLLSTVDVILMGNLDARHIGAIGLGTMVFNFLYWNLGFLRMGTTGLTAQAYGRQDDREVSLLHIRSLLLALGFAVVLLALQEPLLRLGLFLLQVETDSIPLVTQYVHIRIWAAPAALGIYALTGWFLGMQNAWYPLVVTVALNVLNLGISTWLVRGLGWSIDGVAWGTLIAQYAGFGLGLLLWWQRYRPYSLRVEWAGILDWPAFRKLLVLNRDIFIRTLALTTAFAGFTSLSSGAGPLVLAVNVILLQLLNWMSYGIDGFAFAAESLTGKYKGAGDSLQLDRVIRASLVWGFGCALVFSGFIWLGRSRIPGWFTGVPEVLAATKEHLAWMVAVPVLAFASYIWDGIFIGITASRAMRDTMLLAFGVYALLLWAVDIRDLNQLWLAMSGFLLARGVFQWWLYHRKGESLP